MGAGEFNIKSSAMLTDTNSLMTDNPTMPLDSGETAMESWLDCGVPMSGEDASD